MISNSCFGFRVKLLSFFVSFLFVVEVLSAEVVAGVVDSDDDGNAGGSAR